MKKLLIILFFIFPFVTSADFSQSIIADFSDQNINGIGGLTLWYSLGTGLSGSSTSMEMEFNRVAGLPNDSTYNFAIKGFEDEASFLNPASTTVSSFLFGPSCSVTGDALNENVLCTDAFSFDPSVYYTIQLGFNLGSGRDVRFYGNTTQSLGTQHCFLGTIASNTPCTNVVEPYFIISGITSSTSPPVSVSETKILSVNPPPDSTDNATSTDFEITVTGQVTTDDFIAEGTEVYIRYRQETNWYDADNNRILDSGQFTIPLDSSGEFSVATTGNATNIGWYFGYAEIRKPRFQIFGFNILNDTLDSLTWKFEVGSTTAEDYEHALSIFDTSGLAGVASTTDASSNLACNFLGEFTFSGCMQLLFVPSRTELTGTMTEFKDGFLSTFPMGYATRFIVLLNTSSSTVKLPVISATLFVGTGQEENFYLDTDDMFVGGNELLDTVTDPLYGNTFQDVFQPWIRLLFAIIVVLTIAFDVMRMKHDEEVAQKVGT